MREILSTSMETDNTDVTASLPSPLVNDAMTSDVTTNTPTPSSVRNQGKLQQAAICTYKYIHV